MKKHRYYIENLDCANCARKIEETLNKNSKLNNVVVNFNTSKLSYESNDIYFKEIQKLVKQIEPDVTLAEAAQDKNTKQYHWWVLIVGTILGITGSLLTFKGHNIIVVLGYSILLYVPFMNALKMLIKSKTINENALIAISCIGAFLVGEMMEGLMVITLYLIGKILEEKAINNSRRSIKEILNIKQDYANKKVANKLEKIDVKDIMIDDILIVKKGERIPVDGIVVNGKTNLDISALTGESDLLEVASGDEVLSGSINQGEIIEIKASTIFSDSTISRILELVEEATDKKANTETLVSRLSKIYTPVVLFLALLVALILPLFNIPFSESIYRGLTFLVIACPCAIAISVPLSYFTGIGVSSKNAILMKGSNYLDQLSYLDMIIFDKTGTLTTGSFTVKDIEISSSSYAKEEIIDLIVKGESLSNHPIAVSLLKLTDKNIETNDVRDFKEIDGIGISYQIGDKMIKIGNNKNCISCAKDSNIHVNINGKHVATIMIDDGIKDNAKEVIEKLHSLKIKTVMFTGDKKENALEIGKRLSLDEVYYEMLPTDKYHKYEVIKGAKSVAFVGDGINDAPTLKRADIGISMGNIGSSSAIEASDIVIMNDNLLKIPKAIEISKFTNFIIKQNLIFSIGVKILILGMSVFGYASMWAAVFADTGVTLLTVLNTLRIMRKFKS